MLEKEKRKEGKERKGKERKGKERKGKERKGKERNVPARPYQLKKGFWSQPLVLSSSPPPSLI